MKRPYLIQREYDLARRAFNEAQTRLELAERMAANPREWSIDDLELSVRTYNCFRNPIHSDPARIVSRINTLGDLLDLSEHDLMKLRNFGKRSLAEVKERLGEYGLVLRVPK